MPLYELVLQFPDGREEIRLTDEPVAVGDTVAIRGASWEVVAPALTRSAAEIGATAGFLCELTREQRARAVEMRLEDEQRRFRIADRARHGRVEAGPPR
jgi:hypothetical protein